jgi:hypothetical protein
MAELPISDDVVDKALDAIARTPAGYVFYWGLQTVAFTLPDGKDPSDSALRDDFARRSFALELMSKMTKGLDESYGSADPNDKPSRRLVVIRPREPAVANERKSINQRLRDEFPDPSASR